MNEHRAHAVAKAPVVAIGVANGQRGNAALGGRGGAPAAAARADLSIITSAERLELRDGTTLYEVEGRTSRGRERELIIAPDGTIVRSRDD